GTDSVRTSVTGSNAVYHSEQCRFGMIACVTRRYDMTIRRSVAFFAAMIVAGMLLCGAAALQIDIPARSGLDEGYDPQAPIPPGYVLTTAEPPAAADDSGNGPDPAIDSPATP